MMDENLKRTILLDHYSHPRNKGLSDDPTYRTLHMASDSCIDDIKVQVKVKDGIVEDLRFDGVGCTISFASTSIFTELLKGKSVKEANTILKGYKLEYSGTGSKVIYQSPEEGYYVKDGTTIKLMLGD